MASLKAALQQRLAALTAEGDAIRAAAEARDPIGMTAEERARDDALFEQCKALRVDIQREDDRMAAILAAPIVPAPAVTGVIDRAADVRRDAAGRLVDSRGQAIPLNATGLPRLIPAADEGDSFVSGRDRAALKPWGADSGHPLGEFLRAVHSARVGAGTDSRLTYQAAAQGAGEAIGADGGFFLRSEISDEIVKRMHGGEILSRVTKRALSGSTNSIKLNVIDETSRATGSRHGGVQGYWVDEGTAPTASRPRFAQTEWKPSKVACLGYASDELLADVAMMESEMFDSFVDELRFLSEDAVVSGSGAGKPQGLLVSLALISVAKETGQGAATIEKANIDKMWARMYARSRAGAVWLINQDVEPQLDDLQMVIGTGGVPVYLPPGGLADTPFARLKGRPVIPVEYCPTLGTIGDIILVNLSEYLLIDKGEPQRASSMHVAFTTDEMAFRVTYRVDGHLRWRTALTPFQGTNTQSPVVALATRA